MKINTELKSLNKRSSILPKRNRLLTQKKNENLTKNKSILSVKSIKAFFQTRKKNLVFTSIIFTLVLIIALFVYRENMNERSMEQYTEITFIAPNQALIFWKTQHEALGYVSYGSTRFGKKTVVPQTSSEPSTIHVVILEDIPIEGTYIQKNTETKPFWIYPQTTFISYETNTEDE